MESTPICCKHLAGSHQSPYWFVCVSPAQGPCPVEQRRAGTETTGLGRWAVPSWELREGFRPAQKDCLSCNST